MDWEQDRNGINVMHVQLTDLEDAAHVPTGYAVSGKQVGNLMWRSPEAHAESCVLNSSDIFSFGVVVSNILRCIASTLKVATDCPHAVHLRCAKEKYLCRGRR